MWGRVGVGGVLSWGAKGITERAGIALVEGLLRSGHEKYARESR